MEKRSAVEGTGNMQTYNLGSRGESASAVSFIGTSLKGVELA